MRQAVRVFPTRALVSAVFLCGSVHGNAAVFPAKPVLFVTQAPLPKEHNGDVSNTFLSAVALFGNHLADPVHAGRGGDLWLMTTNLGLVNLTRRAGYGASGSQDGIGISVRDPAVDWSGTRALFSMVVGAPTNASDNRPFFWQLYELTNLAAVVANTNTQPAIIPVPNQGANYNNLSPCYGTDGRILFTSDRPFNGAAHLYPSLEEYKGNPSVTGIWSLDPASGNLRLLNHTPSGAFNPIVDSFGRVIFTRWDHLVQDANATDDRLGRATNGAVNFMSEAPGAATLPVVPEDFPEPRNFDSARTAALGVNGNAFNFFFPWQMPETGGSEELLNHVGRHELANTVSLSFTNDANLISLTAATNRAACGIVSANTNYLVNLFQIAEDPRNAGTYFGVDAPDFSPAGGTHTAGQILTLTGAPGVSPTGMVIRYITPKSTAAPNAVGIYRNPLPMSDGLLVAAFTPTPGSGVDTNLGTEAFPSAAYRFRLVTLATNGASGGYQAVDTYLTGGLTNPASYWAGGLRVTQTNALWELQPVEVRSRTIPTPTASPVPAIEQSVFAAENVDLTTFQADLAARGLALVVSRNVTARDAADKQQPYNLRVPDGGAQTLGTATGRVYDVTHLQYMQADYLRGYTLGTTNLAPGRRVLATPLHATAALNVPSARSNAPPGGIEIMADGSQAALVPANRAITWQLTGTNANAAVVRERYWISFRPGEVRSCANCHGINAVDQSGRPPPTNTPVALQQLLRLWRTNSVNAYSLAISNSPGSGTWGAGTILTLTSAVPPSGMVFDHWAGAGIGNPNSPTTTFVMPAGNAWVQALYRALAPPNITAWQLAGSGGHLTAQAESNQPWVVQSSGDLTLWTNILTAPADASGFLQVTSPVTPSTAQQYYRLTSP